MSWDAIQRLRDASLKVHPPVNTARSYRIARHSFSEDGRCDLHLEDDKWTFHKWDYIPGPGCDDFSCAFASIEAAVEAVLAFYFGQPTIVDGWIFPLHLHPELQEGTVRAALARGVAITENQFEAIEKNRVANYLSKIEEARRPLTDWWQRVTTLAAHELAGKDSLEQIRIVCELEDVGKLPARPERIPSSNYEWALQSQFLKIHHANEIAKTLRLRRDLREVYIVSGA